MGRSMGTKMLQGTLLQLPVRTTAAESTPGPHEADGLFNFHQPTHAGFIMTGDEAAQATAMKIRLPPAPDSSAQIHGDVDCILPIGHREVDQL